MSNAKLLLPPSCPEKFRYAQDHERAPKKVWDFGHLAHLKVLGTGPAMFVLDPEVHGKTKDGKVSDAPANTKMWKDEVAAARARHEVPVTIDNWNTADLMAAKVRAHPEAGLIFAEGDAEQSLYTVDSVTGVQLRGRTDWLEPNGDIDDYKTSNTANPAELRTKFWKLGYFMQAAWYIDMVVALEISENPRFRFVVQEKDPPFVVTVIEYEPEAIAEGRRKNREAIDLYARCMESGSWPGYSDSTVVLDLPPWAYSQGPTLGEVFDSYQYDIDPLSEEYFSEQ